MAKDHDWVDAKIRIPKGARLSTSTSTPGADSALLFDRKTGKTLGPAEVRVGEGSSLGEQILATALTSAAALAIAHAPEIKERVQEDVIPAAKAKWDKLKAGRKRNRTREIEAKNPPADIEAVFPATGVIPNPAGDSGLPKASPIS
jgi:hypothetical protein